MMNFFELFNKGGLVMYPLLLCSLFVVAIAVERFRCYRSADTELEKLLAALKPKLKAADWPGAAAVCTQTQGAVSQVLLAGLTRIKYTSKLESTLENAAQLEAANLRRNLSYLDTIVTLSPLLGLLGTVVGMIQSFSVFNVKSGQPMAITGGVGEALVATAAGLCVAVLALLVHSYYSHRLDAVVTDMEQACSVFLNSVAGDE
jgi:biopolymer transport protein ExbB